MTKLVKPALALALARRGFFVLPCRENKTPLTPRGHLDASRDPDTVRLMFARPSAALIGVATGEVSRCAVLDIDSAEALAWVRRQRLPETVVVRTRRGWHLWFRDPPALLRCSTGLLAPGVDVRATGGYAIAWQPERLLRSRMKPWPAHLTPRPRVRADDLDRSPWASVLDAVRDRMRVERALAHRNAVEPPFEEVLIRFLRGAQVGQRHGRMLYAACRCVQHDLDAEAVLARGMVGPTWRLVDAPGPREAEKVISWAQAAHELNAMEDARMAAIDAAGPQVKTIRKGGK